MRQTIILIRFLIEYFKDFLNVIRYNTYSPFEDKELRLYYRIIITTHTLEKGLSLFEMRPLFGKAKLRELRFLESKFEGKLSKFPLQKLHGALIDYIAIHDEMGVKDPMLENLRIWVAEIETKCPGMPLGGVKVKEEITLPSIESRHKNISFLNSRFSCRNFEAGILPAETVTSIISLAQRAPSQCNRQSVKVHCYQDKETIRHLLGLQGGANGFSGRVHNLFIISSESTAWGGLGQRNQAFVDGGIFSNMLMLSLNAHGFGCCSLNLAVSNDKETAIKKLANIHARERLIMMVAFGIVCENNLKVAKSPRLPTNLILQIHS